MPAISSSKIFPCQWDWCRSTFLSIDDLDTHVKREHIWPMKPMRKSEIALMRRMDLQSLHSFPGTISSIGSILVPSRDTRQSVKTGSRSQSTPIASTPPRRRRAESEDFNTFQQLSSPIQATSPQRLSVSPALEGLVRGDARSGLTAAVEVFERKHGHKANRHLALPSQQHSPTQTPHSQSSVSSQDVVEQQLTQEDEMDMDVHRDTTLLRANSEDGEVTEVELQWPDEEVNESSQSHVDPEETRNLEQPMASQGQGQGGSQGSTRGQQFRSGSLAISLGGSNGNVAPFRSHSSPACSTQRSKSPSQPFALQTQAPYFSQTMDWSQTQ